MADFFSRAGVVDAGKRAVRTFAQTLAGSLVVVTSGVFDIDWKAAAVTAGLAALISLLHNISGDLVTSKTGE
ncbi:holin [Nocardia vinacea]|uniref:Holin n=1 Tax=Nocardia vinacea TaxID=96468 RepID=A0ABZ1YKF1_9NOCA|nr:holin [Nocardia vinacea]